MFSFLCDLICGNTETRDRINDLRHNLNRENNLIVKKYLKTVDYRYNLLKFKKIFKGLRFLQFLGGFGITTMTTYNNPYFKENTDLKLVLWYGTFQFQIILLIF